jgi:hypothetical protein
MGGKRGSISALAGASYCFCCQIGADGESGIFAFLY